MCYQQLTMLQVMHIREEPERFHCTRAMKLYRLYHDHSPLEQPVVQAKVFLSTVL